jgi:hypothetical protein
MNKQVDKIRGIREISYAKVIDIEKYTYSSRILI